MERQFTFTSAKLSREDFLAKDPLGEFFVWWLEATHADADALEQRINGATNEGDLQTYLEQHPMGLIQHLRGGHGRYVIPQKRFGAEYVTDFVIGHKHSGGYEWQAVELESPQAKMFTKAGDPTKELTHAIRQIQDWRAWLQRNQSYAARPRTESGLGLTDIVAAMRGLILIGRRSDNDPANNDRRRQMSIDLDIELHSFDFLIENCRCSAEANEKHFGRNGDR